MNMTRTPLALATLSLLAITACTDAARFDPGNPNNPNNNRDQGILLGGIAGAIAGLATADDDKTEGLIAGAVIGAAGGGLIGNRLDKQEAALRQQLGNDRVLINNTGSELIVTLPQDILFATNSATLRSDLVGDLGALADNLQQFPDSTVDIIGHTDSDGSAEFNQSLSQDRARSVEIVLLNNGVAASRTRAFGRGENEPVATNLSDEGKRQNRRVEIVIRPTT